MMLHMTRLNVLSIACNERHVLALLILKTDLPAIEELWSGLDVLEPRILVRSFELATHNVLKAIVGNDMMMGALVFD